MAHRKPNYKPIRKHLRRKLLLRWLILLATAAAFVILCVIAKPFCLRREHIAMICMTTGIYLFILWKSRLLPRTFAREWTGTVLSRTCKKVMISKTFLPTRTSWHYAVVATWVIRRDPRHGEANPAEEAPIEASASYRRPTWDGEDHETTPEAEGDDIEKLSYDTEDIHEHYFEVGEKVRLYKNAKFLVKAHPPKEEENLICPLCGLLVMEPKCPHCAVIFEENAPPEA